MQESSWAAEAQAFAAIAQGVIAVGALTVTVVAARYARNAWRTARAQRLDALMPVIQIEWTGESQNTTSFSIQLRSVGAGPAIGVAVTLEPCSQCRPPRSPLPYVPTNKGRIHAERPFLLPVGATVAIDWIHPGFQQLRQAQILSMNEDRKRTEDEVRRMTARSRSGRGPVPPTAEAIAAREAQLARMAQNARDSLNYAHRIMVECVPFTIVVRYKDAFGDVFTARTPVAGARGTLDPDCQTGLELAETEYIPPPR